MDQQEFAILFDGEEVRNGRMDVRDLAPSLLALGDLCQRANRVLNEDRAEASVKVLAQPRKGSFEVVVELWQSIPEHTKQIVGEYVAANAHQLLVYLGMAIDTAGKPGTQSLLEFLRTLAGRWPVRAEQESQKSEALTIHIGDQLSAGDQATLAVNKNTFLLASDREVRRHIEAVLAPLRSGRVDLFQALDTGRIASEVKGEETPYFEAPEESTSIALSEGESERTVEVESVQFRDDLKWRFKTGDGGETERFTALMRDPVFLARLDDRQERFAKGDIMKIRLRTKDVETPQGIRTEREVLRVIDHHPPYRQLDLLEE